MIFNSGVFLAFFVAFYVLYWCINQRGTVTVRNIFLLLSSYIFYGYWDVRFLTLIAASSLLDFFLAHKISESTSAKTRKRLLFLSVAFNIGLLAGFKYLNFFIEGLSHLFTTVGIPHSLTTLSIILPVGLSFYTFQTLSYTIDVYNKNILPEKKLLSFMSYVSFFPQLVAGPIERASDMLPQFAEKKIFNKVGFASGCRLILWGLFLKVVIADNMGIIADSFLEINVFNGTAALVGTLAFSFQIYGDFAGYSTIAIGLGQLLGFSLSDNFRSPYFSARLREFWQRWHITLSTWFRDYVYIPLGGSRFSNYINARNILITFGLSGLWHGNNLTFAIWGLGHGILLIAERRFVKSNETKWFHSLVVFILVTLLWIPFRAESVSHMMSIASSISNFSSYSSLVSSRLGFNTAWFVTLLLLVVLWMLVERRLLNMRFDHWLNCFTPAKRYVVYFALILVILVFGQLSIKPSFIYFQF
jgi:alginate O-acetyltransferase complex protein AlgI